MNFSTHPHWQAFVYKPIVFTNENWVKIFFSNESKFNLDSLDGKQYVQLYKQERLLPKCV